MPIPPTIPIVPGTLCWLRRAYPQNIGAVVEVVRFYGFVLEGYEESSQKLWSIVCSRPLYTTSFPSRKPRIAPAGEVLQAFESMLVPIAGPGLVDEVTAYDKAWQDEKRAAHAISYGAPHTKLYGTAARPISNIRR